MSEPALRLDLWLHRTRMFKTRTLATAFAAKGRVRITRHKVVRRAKGSATPVCVDDVLTFAQKQRIMVVRVLRLPTRRGSACEAVLCYAQLQEKQHV
jgi:ribosome-associated heat shock protein Hsp15